MTTIPFRSAALALTVAVTFGGLAAASPAVAASGTGAADAMARTTGVDERVSAIAVSGSTVVLGGAFSRASSPAGDGVAAEGLAKIDRTTGAAVPWPVSIVGEVRSVAVSGDTVYLGGEFTQVNATPRENLAAVSLSTGELLPWSPSANRAVEALAVASGQVYVGGKFTAVTDASGEHPQAHIARFGVAGELDQTWSGGLVLDGRVRSLMPSPDGQRIWVGGDFLTANGSGGTRGTRIVRVSTGTSADVDPTFQSVPTNEGSRAPIFHMALDGNDLLLAVGGSGGACSLVDATTGSLRWTHHANGNVVGAAFLGDKAYCGGHFGGDDSFGGLNRAKLAEVEIATGRVTSRSWTVNSAQGLFALTSDATTLYAGGDFTKVGSVTQPHFGFIYDRSSIRVPRAPEGIVGRGGDGQVVLSWDTPSTDGGSSLKRYTVYQVRSDGSVKKVGRSSTTSYVDTDVVNGAPVSYEVRAHNAVGSSEPSQRVTVTPLAGVILAPGAPLELTAKGKRSTAVLSWSPPVSDGGSAITAYQVYRGTTSGELSKVADVSPTARTYTDSNVGVGRRYFYRVVAVNIAGAGPDSKEVFATPNTGVPSAPTLSADATTPGRVALSWKPSPRTTGDPTTKYVLTRDAVRVAVTDGATTDFIDAGVTAGSTHTYQVKASNSYGPSPLSSPVTVTVR